MAWTALIMAAGAAAGSAITASGKAKAERERTETEIKNRVDAINASEKARKASVKAALGGDFLGRFGTDDIFGTKPQGIDPISVNEGLTRNVNQIRSQGLPAAQEFTSVSNEQLSGETLALNLDRMRSLVPNFDTISGQIGSVTEDLLFGRLPFDDVLDIVSDRQSLAGTLGTPGGQTSATLKDLGISRLQAQQQGFGMFQGFANTLATAVSPIPQFRDALGTLPFTSLTADQRVGRELETTAALQQAELIRSMPDPAAHELFQQDFLAGQTAAGIRAGTAIPNFNAGIGTSALGTGITAGTQFYGQQQLAKA
jgi:hypothetical protein